MPGMVLRVAPSGATRVPNSCPGTTHRTGAGRVSQTRPEGPCDGAPWQGSVTCPTQRKNRAQTITAATPNPAMDRYAIIMIIAWRCALLIFSVIVRSAPSLLRRRSPGNPASIGQRVLTTATHPEFEEIPSQTSRPSWISTPRLALSRASGVSGRWYDWLPAWISLRSLLSWSGGFLDGRFDHPFRNAVPTKALDDPPNIRCSFQPLKVPAKTLSDVGSNQRLVA